MHHIQLIEAGCAATPTRGTCQLPPYTVSDIRRASLPSLSLFLFCSLSFSLLPSLSLSLSLSLSSLSLSLSFSAISLIEANAYRETGEQREERERVMEFRTYGKEKNEERAPCACVCSRLPRGIFRRTAGNEVDWKFVWCLGWPR